MELIFILPLLLAGGLFAALSSGGDDAPEGEAEPAPEDENPDTGNGAQSDGSAGNDTLWGSSLNDDMNGQNGNDSVIGYQGGDSLSGGLGDDTLRGGFGMDALYGNQGADVLSGGEQGDSLFGGFGYDDLFGMGGRDALAGGNGDDELYGGWGHDTLNGDVGNDRLLGSTGNDSLYGGVGLDTLYGGAGDDRLTGESLFGGAGNDEVTLYARDVGVAGPVTLFAEGGDGVDNILFSGLIPASTAPLLDAALSGGDGNDYLTVSTGGDVTLAGGAGDDSLLTFDTESTMMTGGAGVDRFMISANHANQQDDGAVTVTDFNPAAGEMLSVRIHDDPDAGFGGGAIGEAILQADATGTGTLMIYKGITYAHIIGLLPGDIPDESLLIDLVANPGGD